MKKNFIYSILFVAFMGCKKDNKNVHQDNVIKNYLFGLEETDLDSLQLVPIADTSFLFSLRQGILPEAFSLEMPPIESQGNEGSCVAFATGYAARSFHLFRDAGFSYYLNGSVNPTRIFSPEFLYNSAKNIGSCETAGMNIKKSLDFLKNTGIATWDVMPYSDNNGCNLLPDLIQLQFAEQYKIDDYCRIDDISTNYLKNVIYNGYPIIFGAKIDSTFWQNGKFIWKSNQGKIVGNHAMVICGWDDSKNAFKIMNSWGKAWGYEGYGWVDYNFLKSILLGVFNNYEMYVLQTSLPEDNFNLTLSNSSKYPSISIPKQNNLCNQFVTCDFQCSANNWNPIKKIPMFKDANGKTREINGVLEYELTSNWGAPNKWIHAGKPVFSGNDTVNVVEFYNVKIIDGLVSGKVRIYGDIGTCDPIDYPNVILTSFKYALINTTLLNKGFSSDTIDTYTIGSNSLFTEQ